MDEQRKTNILTENVGRYVIKVGDYYVSSYKHSWISGKPCAPKELAVTLSKVEETIQDVAIAKTLLHH